jgi:hypothetical protein
MFTAAGILSLAELAALPGVVPAAVSAAALAGGLRL